MEYIKEITVNLSGPMYFNYVTAVQGDEKSRFVKITILSGSLAFSPPAGARAVLRCKKPDETFVFNDATINDDGTITAELNENMLAAVGNCRCEITIYKNGSSLTTVPFIVRVTAGAVNPAVESVDEYTALTNALKKVDDVSGIASSALADATAAYNKMASIEADIDAHTSAAAAATEEAKAAAAAAPKAFMFVYDDSGASDATNKAVLSEYLEYNGTAACYVKLGVMTMPASVRKIGRAISIRADTAEFDTYYHINVNEIGCTYETVPKYDEEVDEASTNAPSGSAVAEYVKNAAANSFKFIYDESGSSDAANIALMGELTAYTGTPAVYIRRAALTMPAQVKRIGSVLTLNADDPVGSVYYSVRVTVAGCTYETVSKYDEEVDETSANAPSGSAVAEYVKNAAAKSFKFIYDESGASDAANIAEHEKLRAAENPIAVVQVEGESFPAEIRLTNTTAILRGVSVRGGVYYTVTCSASRVSYNTVEVYDDAIDPDSTNAPSAAAVAAYVEEYTAEHMPEQTGGAVIEEITIPADGWAEDASSAYPYRADVTVSTARESAVPVAAIHSSSLSTARKAGVSPSVKAVDGSVSFWAEKIPGADILCTVALLGVSAPSADIVLPIATRDTLGVVKIGANLGIETDGTVSASGTGVSDGDIAGDADVSSMLDSVFGGGASEDDPTVPDEEVAGEGEVEEMLNGVFGGQ